MSGHTAPDTSMRRGPRPNHRPELDSAVRGGQPCCRRMAPPSRLPRACRKIFGEARIAAAPAHGAASWSGAPLGPWGSWPGLRWTARASGQSALYMSALNDPLSSSPSPPSLHHPPPPPPAPSVPGAARSERNTGCARCSRNPFRLTSIPPYPSHAPKLPSTLPTHPPMPFLQVERNSAHEATLMRARATYWVGLFNKWEKSFLSLKKKYREPENYESSLLPSFPTSPVPSESLSLNPNYESVCSFSPLQYSHLATSNTSLYTSPSQPYSQSPDPMSPSRAPPPYRAPPPPVVSPTRGPPPAPHILMPPPPPPSNKGRPPPITALLSEEAATAELARQSSIDSIDGADDPSTAPPVPPRRKSECQNSLAESEAEHKISVRDAMQKFNRLASENELQRAHPPSRKKPDKVRKRRPAPLPGSAVAAAHLPLPAGHAKSLTMRVVNFHSDS
ncbi:hypothetical protein L1887_52100 [Cichorium endivia]|nr:hypothetical protein L1887_52100 [Cichorium endivia]